jgi:flagellar motility protein MotE (MotC chaperone)
MNDHSLTIEQQILKLADGTDAPPGFLDQIRKLFESKGIELSEDATPYMSALREAFRREQSIRRSTLDAHRNLDRLQTHFKSIGTTYRRQLQQLKQVQRALERRATALEAAGDDGTRGARRYVTRVQKDDPFLVPGPDELQ